MRAKLTWQSFDSQLWLAAFGSLDELKSQVCKPHEFIGLRDQLVLGFSDQVPLWIKQGSVKLMFAEHEVKAKDQKLVRAEAQRRFC